MKRMSLRFFQCLLLLVCFVCGTYTLPVAWANRKSIPLSIVKGLLNVLMTVICFCAFLARVVWECVYALSGLDASASIGSLYLVSFMAGEMYLSLVLATVGSTALRRFFNAFDVYRSNFPRNERGIVFIASVSIWAVMLVLFPQLTVTTVTYKVQSFCASNQSFPVEGLDLLVCHPVYPSLSSHFTSGVFGTSFLLYLSVWRFLMTEANSLVANLKKQDKATLIENPERLELFRLQHEEICELIVKANKCLRHIIAALLGAGVPCILFVIHGFVYKQLQTEEFNNMVTFFVGLVLYLTAVIITGVFLNLKMHEPSRLLFPLNIVKSSGKGSEVIAAFLARVQGPPIGFNVYHLFTVDPSTILMVSGTILTYAVVIIQFQPTQGALDTQARPSTHPQDQSIRSLLSSLPSPNLTTHAM